MITQVSRDKEARNKAAVEEREHQVLKRYEMSIKQAAQAIGATNMETVVVASLPRQANKRVKPETTRQEAFKQHLNVLIGKAYPYYTTPENTTDDDSHTNRIDPGPSHAEIDEAYITVTEFPEKIPEERIQSEAELHPVVNAVCTTCRGYCCRTGSDTAHLDQSDLKRWRTRNPEATVEDARQAYMSLLPEHSIESACIYQSAEGCALPREMRNNHCNTYQCESLNNAIKNLHESDTGRVILLAHHRGHDATLAGWSPQTGYINVAIPDDQSADEPDSKNAE